MKSSIPLILLVLAAAAAAGQAPVNSKAPDFTLQDPHGREFRLRSTAGRIVVLIASDKEGSSQNPAWSRELEGKKSGDIEVLGVADLRSVPGFWRWKIRSDFKKERDRILLDWKGEVFTAYGLAEKVSNVILIDRGGAVRFIHAGPATPEAVERLFEAIHSLMH